MTAPPCDPEIFKHGKGICTFHAAAVITEPWVQKVAAESGQRVDWHYSAGYVNVLYIGDYSKVMAAIEKLKPELYEAAKTEPWGIEHFRLLPEGSHGLYRRGDELPDGVIAIDNSGL